MNQNGLFVILLAGVTAFLCGSTSQPCIAGVADAAPEKTLVLKLSDLRSAYLVRAGIVAYEPPAADGNPIPAQIQRHFDVVLVMLSLSTPHSVQVALDRLESSRGENWSAEKRGLWRRRLLANRQVQLLRLAGYRDRGSFPLNEGQSLQAAPIFVDTHGTACAVGHLMRLSRWTRAVGAIEASNNLVYVPDIQSGPVAEWVMTSGITMEEAALIQPAYPNFPSQLPAIPPDAAKPLEAGWSGEFDDLRFSNFQFYRHGATAPSVNADVMHSFCQSYGCSILPRIEDYTGIIDETGWFGVLPDGFNDFQRVVVRFDVETLLPGQRFVNKPTGRTAYTLSGEPVLAQRNSILLFAGEAENELYLSDVADWGTYSLPVITEPGKFVLVRPINFESESFLGISGANDFEPTRRMTVVTELLLLDGQSYQTQLLNFEVAQVPEPSSIISFMAALAAVTACRSRKSACVHFSNRGRRPNRTV